MTSASWCLAVLTAVSLLVFREERKAKEGLFIVFMACLMQYLLGLGLEPSIDPPISIADDSS
jgi:hypothetical protein